MNEPLMMTSAARDPADADADDDRRPDPGTSHSPRPAASPFDDEISTDSTFTVMQYLLIMASTVSSIANIASMAWMSDNDDDDVSNNSSSDGKGLRHDGSASEVMGPSPDPLLKTGLSREEWQALCEMMVPVIDGTSKSTGVQKRKRGRPPKLSAETRLMNCLLFLKKDESMSKASAAEDCIYICDLICQTLADQIAWPDAARRDLLSRRSLPGCIGIADDVIVHIPRPLIAPLEFFSPLHNGHVILSVVAVDHDGFIIGVDAARPGSLERSAPNLFGDSRPTMFTFADDAPIEYLVGQYDGFGEGGMLRALEATIANAGVVLEAFQAKRDGRRVLADWGIAGLRAQWDILSKPFTARRDKFNTILTACCILTNFLHRRRRRLEFDAADSNAKGSWNGGVAF